MFTKKKIALFLITAGCIGFVVAVFYSYRHASASVPMPTQQTSFATAANSSLPNRSAEPLVLSGLLTLSFVMMAVGSYLIGYLKASIFTNRLTLDYTKKPLLPR